MKKIILLLICALCMGVFGSKLHSQPQTAQWPFHLAFEDATGAKDTLWFVFDESATAKNIWTGSIPYSTGQDPQFGEIPIEICDSTFSVWMLGLVSFVDNDPGISDIVWGPFDVEAKPSTGYGVFSAQIHASNYQLPLTVRWDSTLFANDFVMSAFNDQMSYALLSNDFLFNYDFTGAFCMSLNPSELVLPPFDWASEEHFPLWFQLSQGSCFILSAGDQVSQDINIYPNPAKDVLRIELKDAIESYQIMNLHGQKVIVGSINDAVSFIEIDVSTLSPGVYLLMVNSATGRDMVKFVKE